MKTIMSTNTRSGALIAALVLALGACKGEDKAVAPAASEARDGKVLPAVSATIDTGRPTSASSAGSIWLPKIGTMLPRAE